MIEVGPPAYTGRRRAGQPRYVFVAVLVVVALVALLLRTITGGGGTPHPQAEVSFEAPAPVVPPVESAAAATSAAANSPSARPSRSVTSAPASSNPPPAQSPSTSPSAGGTPAKTIEAEAPANRRPGQMTVREVSTASGGRAVTGVGNNRVLEFTGVTAARPGEVTVTVAYLSTEERSCWLRAGGGTWQQVRFPASGAWDRVATVTLTVRLNAGQNTIEAGNTTGRWCPDLDRITVAPR
ncbi:hypothetical protein ACFPIJ_55365 [Dactylosporangium cerinum]|uniref:CBM6 domain-containing protein n=1 Tax=Dactylosporangium cerinum TaxID=1434730 RepID=A0ABV9WG37_9ACTN